MSGLSGIENVTLKQYAQQLVHPTRGEKVESLPAQDDRAEITQSGELAGRMVFYAVQQHSFGISSEAAEAGEVEETESSGESSIFDFEKVARHVLSFIAGVIGGARKQGENDEKIDELMGQARIGVDLGFEEARVELDKVGILDGSLNEGIDKSYDLIQDGLDDIEAGRYQIQSVNSPVAAMSAQESSRLELTTAEGDKVELVFGYHFSGGLSHSEEGNALSLMLNNRSDMMFSVEGELNDEELQAIADLVVDLDDIGNRFYSGSLDTAFEQASQLGFDDSQIATFAVNFEMTRQVQLQRGYGEQASPLAQLLPNLHEFINDWEGIKQRSEQQFKEPEALQELEAAAFNEALAQVEQSPDLFERFNQFTERLNQTHYEWGE